MAKAQATGRGLVLLVFGWLAALCGAVEYDVSWTPLANGGAEQGLAGWRTKGVAVAGEPAPEGVHCFKLASTGGMPAELRSEPLSVRRGERLQLAYELKMDRNSLNGVGSATVAVRFLKRDKTAVAGESRFDLWETGGKWLGHLKPVAGPDEAAFVEIVFSLQVGPDAKPAILLLDAIAVHREIRYQPLYGDIKPLAPGDSLWVFTADPTRSGRQAIALQTLQGVTARRDRPRLWLDLGDPTFLNNLADNYGIQFDRSHARDFEALLGELKPWSSGRYVLYDIDDKPSISAATTLAGLLDGVAIDIELEAAAIGKGYVKALDVRGKDCRWVYETYRDQINEESIVVHTNDVRHHPSAYHLRDWGPATRCLDWWHDDEAVSREVYRSMAPVTPVYGWQDPTTSDEGLSVKLHSETGLFQMPSDWMVNLSVHAAMGPVMKDRTFYQKAARRAPVREEGVHYVTFIMSDMDNILTEIGTNSFYSTRKFYRNPHRGEFPMSWGMAPSLVELSPAGLELWYNNATGNDVFVGYCGLGYFYPSVAPYLQTHMKRLAGFLERADLRTMLIIDRVLPDGKLTDAYYETAKWFTGLSRLRGLFYLEYVQYAPHQGNIFWFDNKPMVTARFDFRTEEFYPAVRPTAAALAASINALPKDPSRPEGYTFVTVHAWSKGMDDIYETIQRLDPAVRVVNAEEFIEQVRLNLSPSR